MDLFSLKPGTRRDHIACSDREGVFLKVGVEGTEGVETGRGVTPCEAVTRFWDAFGKGCDSRVEDWCKSEGRILFRGDPRG